MFSISEEFTLPVKYEPGILQQLKNVFSKICYQSIYKVKAIINADHTDKVWILGRHCQTKEIIEQTFSKLIWITYRQHIQGQIRSDVGWGCMIRVGQMMLAQAFRRHLKIQNTNQQNKLMHIITSFIDEDEDKVCLGNYSIQKIMKVANQMYDMQQGDWFTPPNISYVLQKLHNTNPLKGTQNMVIEIREGYLFYDQVSKLMKKRKSVLIVVLCLTGIKRPERQYTLGIKQIMKSPYFNGMIGGIPKKAHYFIGMSPKNYIYLDPHFVQDSKSKSHIQINEFFCPHLLSTNSQTINPSLGICFYVRDQKQLILMFNNLATIKTTCTLPFFADKNQKTKYQIQPCYDSDEFEIIGQQSEQQQIIIKANHLQSNIPNVTQSCTFETITQQFDPLN